MEEFRAGIFRYIPKCPQLYRFHVGTPSVSHPKLGKFTRVTKVTFSAVDSLRPSSRVLELSEPHDPQSRYAPGFKRRRLL